MIVPEEGDSRPIFVRTLGNYFARLHRIMYGKTRCEIFSCLKYSSNYMYHQFNAINACILPTKSVYVFRVLYKRRRLFRGSNRHSDGSEDADLLCCDSLSSGESGRDYKGK